jgi:hypothetical protein
MKKAKETGNPISIKGKWRIVLNIDKLYADRENTIQNQLLFEAFSLSELAW